MHSTASDGTYAPGELVALAGQQGFTLLAVTDHDTTCGVTAAQAAGSACGVRVIPGVELSVLASHGIHLLGHGVDIADAALQRALADMCRNLEGRAQAILERLDKLGCPVPGERVRQLAREGAVGRPHIAMAMVELGYCSSVQEAFARYLGSAGAAYVPRERLSAQRAIDLVLGAGGVPVFAHPGLLPLTSPNLRALIESLRDRGLLGMEVWYPGHSPAQMDMLGRWAQQLGLVATGGSDFHGHVKPHISLGAGTAGAPEGWYEPLLALLERRTEPMEGNR